MPAFTLSPLFTQGAVLTRNKEIRLFGLGKNGDTLSITLLDRDGKPLAQGESVVRDGKFCACLPPQQARTGCSLVVTDGKETAAYSDILIGDVFWAGGQSNMELELQNADEGKRLIPVHENPLVRYFNVPKYPRFSPEMEQANANARWLPILPGNGRDMSAAAYFFAMKLQKELDVPIGIVDCYWGGTSVTCWMDEEALERTTEGRRYKKEYEEKCAGKSMEEYVAEEKAFFDGQNEWNAKAAALREKRPGMTNQQIADEIGPCPPWAPPIGPGSPFRPSGLFHTMVERIVPMTLTGVLFYQGEEDTWRTKQYDILLSSLIVRIRELFRDGALPFLNVQLPMWIDAAAVEDSKLWPALRMAQRKVHCNTRNTGLAILIDQGEYDNIHPTNKRVVGERLAEEAKRVIYHLPGQEAPMAIQKYTEGDTLVIALSQTVKEREEGEYLMEIAGEDGKYFPAEVSVLGASLRLCSDCVPKPRFARYAWTDYAIVRLFGENGLPLAPFVMEG